VPLAHRRSRNRAVHREREPRRQLLGHLAAEHEYAIEDVDLSRSPRQRSQESYGIGDELRGSFVAGDTYWGAATFLRDSDRS
jgi:hypothetical protein